MIFFFAFFLHNQKKPYICNAKQGEIPVGTADSGPQIGLFLLPIDISKDLTVAFRRVSLRGSLFSSETATAFIVALTKLNAKQNEKFNEDSRKDGKETNQVGLGPRFPGRTDGSRNHRRQPDHHLHRRGHVRHRCLPGRLHGRTGRKEVNRGQARSDGIRRGRSCGMKKVELTTRLAELVSEMKTQEESIAAMREQTEQLILDINEED